MKEYQIRESVFRDPNAPTIHHDLRSQDLVAIVKIEFHGMPDLIFGHDEWEKAGGYRQIIKDYAFKPGDIKRVNAQLLACLTLPSSASGKANPNHPTNPTMTIFLQGGYNAANTTDTKELQDLVANMFPSDLLAIVKAHQKDPLTENEHDAIRTANKVLDDEEGEMDLGDFCCYQVPVLLDAIKRLSKS